MSMLQVTKKLLRRSQCRQLTSSAAALQEAGKKMAKKVIDDDTFELLPPGCSIADPSYGHSLSDPVFTYDPTPGSAEEYKPPAARKSKAVPAAPTSRAAAQAKLDEKKAAEAESDEPYVYLPPGSSMRDPGYHSMSDPTDRRIYYRDPSPTLRKP